MAVLTINPQSIPSGALRTSATRTITATTHDLHIQMTDSGGSWAGTTGNLLIWGVQVSPDNGTTWNWIVWAPGRDDPTQAGSDGISMPFGTTAKDGSLPALGIAATALLADVGHLVRLAIRVDTTITLGVTITAV